MYLTPRLIHIALFPGPCVVCESRPCRGGESVWGDSDRQCSVPVEQAVQVCRLWPLSALPRDGPRHVSASHQQPFTRVTPPWMLPCGWFGLRLLSTLSGALAGLYINTVDDSKGSALWCYALNSVLHSNNSSIFCCTVVCTYIAEISQTLYIYLTHVNCIHLFCSQVLTAR